MNSMYSGSEIAVIGISCRFPGAADPLAFWKNLAAGRESIRFLTSEELSQVPEKLRKDPKYVPCCGGTVGGKDLFDAEFFQYTALEAKILNPQTRLFHECAWEALEDACVDPRDKTLLTGLYAAASSDLFWDARIMRSPLLDQLGYFAVSGLSDKEMLATRVSYKMDLRGPSLMVHTTCSSSLVAVHLACQALLNGECDIALAGGVCLHTQEHQGYIHQEGMILSPDGHCRAFDVAAAGTVGGEGAAVVVLRPLEDALRDGNPIYALIKGSAVNNDGSNKLGYSAPGVEGQVRVIQTALQVAEVDPASVSLIETHGTGTEIGDPIEIEALRQTYGALRTGPCAIGSLKTNIGHLDTAAGIAGLLKAVLCLKYGQIPASLHFNTFNKKIDPEGNPFFVNTRLRDWETEKGPRRAGVSSFGIGGTNAHVVLEEAPARMTAPVSPSVHGRSAAHAEKHYCLLPLSARNPAALVDYAGKLASRLKEESGIALEDLSVTLQQGRRAFDTRVALACADREEAIRRLENLQAADCRSAYKDTNHRKAVFLFSGQGNQYPNMARGLYAGNPVFRKTMDRGLELYQELTGTNIRNILWSEDPAQNGLIHQTLYAQPLLYMVEYSLARVLAACGVEPVCMIGHSIGEYAAAAIAGVFSFEDGLRLTTGRGRLMQALPAGSMISVSAPPAELRQWLDKGISLAAVNTGSSCVLSGDHESIRRCAEELVSGGITVINLQTSHAFHSRMMEPALAPFRELCGTVTLRPPRIPFISNVTGALITSEQACDPGYWTEHLRSTVRFSEGLGRLAGQGTGEAKKLFIEIGPGRSLTSSVKAQVEPGNGLFLFNTLRHARDEQDDMHFLSVNIGALWVSGHQIDWTGADAGEHALHAGRRGRLISLPTYAFQRKSYWPEEGSRVPVSSQSTAGEQDRFANHGRKELSSWFYIPSWKQAPHLPPLREPVSASYLLFMDEGDYMALLAAQFETRGIPAATVRPGAFPARSGWHFTIRMENPEDYEWLMSSLRGSGFIPDKIVHAWGLCTGGHLTAQQCRIRHYETHLLLIRAIVRQDLHVPTEIMAVTRQAFLITGQEDPNPDKALLSGVRLATTCEFSFLRFRQIDIGPGVNNAELKKKEFLLLCREITGNDPAPGLVAYRNQVRWQQEFHPIRLEKTADTRLRKKGCYLVTGGLGNIGLCLAGYLVRTYQAHVLLLHHGGFPARTEWEERTQQGQAGRDAGRIRLLLQLEQVGGRLTVRDNLDIADGPAMERFINEWETDQKIDGVFHLAGITANERIYHSVEETDLKTSAALFRPKIDGIRVLYDLFRRRNPDFILCASSLAAVLGGLGFAAYGAANAYLDSFVRQVSCRACAFPWISVDLDGWMIGEPPANADIRILNEEGIEAIERILAALPGEQVVVSVAEPMLRLRKWETSDPAVDDSRRGTIPEGTIHDRPALATPFIAPQGEHQEAIADLFRNAFGYSRIGVDDSFFELGGDSLLAVNMVANIHRRLQCRVGIRAFYDHPTVRQLAVLTDVRDKQVFRNIRPVEKKEVYELSEMQKRIYFVSRLNPDSSSYNTPFVIYMEEQLHHEQLQKAWQELVARHDSFRTCFRIVGGRPAQVVEEQVSFQLERLEAPAGSIAGEDRAALAAIATGFNRPFDLEHAPLLRIGHIALGGNRHLLLICIHHIITDAVSNKSFLSELMRLLKGKSLPPPPLQYKDFCRWHRQRLEDPELDRQRSFWLDLLGGDIPYTEIPTDHVRREDPDFRAERISLSFDPHVYHRIMDCIAATGSGPFAFILAVVNILLSKYSGAEDIIVGTETGGRNYAGLERTAGMFVGLLPLRNRPAGRHSFADFLRQVHQDLLLAFENQECPFHDLVALLNKKGRRQTNPLFNIIVSMDKISLGDRHGEEDELKYQIMDFYGDQTIWDMRFGAVDLGDSMVMHITYAASLYGRQTIGKLGERLQSVIAQVLDDREILLKDIRIQQDWKRTEPKRTRVDTILTGNGLLQ